MVSFLPIYFFLQAKPAEKDEKLPAIEYMKYI